MGEGYSKDGKPMAKVCKNCVIEWIHFLDSVVAKMKKFPSKAPYISLGEKVKEEIWLASFKKWDAQFKVRFVFR